MNTLLCAALLSAAYAGAGHSAEDELAEALLAKYDTTKTETLNEAALIAMIKGNTLTAASFKALPAENHTAHTGAAHSEEDELAEALLKKYGAADKMTEAQIITMIKANALSTASFKALPQVAAKSVEDKLAGTCFELRPLRLRPCPNGAAFEISMIICPCVLCVEEAAHPPNRPSPG